MTKRTCFMPECDRPVKCRDRCATHYANWRRNDGTGIRRKPTAPCSIDGCDRPALSRGWCASHYSRWQRNGSPTDYRYRPQGLSREAAFRHYMPGDPPSSECWIWTSTCDEPGYGILGFGKRNVFAHRISYEIFVGPIPDGLITRHTCDNPPCVNPAHLLLGTDADNSDDKVSRKRHAHGVAHSHAKLDDDAIREIRTLRAAGRMYKDIAPIYGVHPGTIGGIVRGERWKHVV